jgi:hypothetical protein
MNVNLVSIHQHLTSSFYSHISQKRKKIQSSRQFFVLLGSARVKAARRTLMKLTPGLSYNPYLPASGKLDPNMLSRNSESQLDLVRTWQNISLLIL